LFLSFICRQTCFRILTIQLEAHLWWPKYASRGGCVGRYLLIIGVISLRNNGEPLAIEAEEGGAAEGGSRPFDSPLYLRATPTT
jgi:hypothetical protein